MKPGSITMVWRVNRNWWNGNTILLRRQRSSKQPDLTRRLWRQFWGTDKGVIHIDYLPCGIKNNLEYYASLFEQVRQSIKEIHYGKIRHGISIHQDNAAVHTSRVVMEAMHECDYELLPHPPYYPDLAPSSCHLFSRLKILLGWRFDDDDELNAVVEGWVEDQDVN